MRIRLPAALLLIALFTACSPSLPAVASAPASVTPSATGATRSAPATASPSTSAASPTAAAVTLAGASSCPRTIGVRAPADIGDQLFGYGSAAGNDDLWVGGLWKDGIAQPSADQVNSDRTIGIKFGWWRRVHGKLTIAGRRLDAPAPPAWGDVPDGYGDVGFQASGVMFPTEGCWEITGRVGSASLTFVTFVIVTR